MTIRFTANVSLNSHIYVAGDVCNFAALDEQTQVANGSAVYWPLQSPSAGSTVGLAKVVRNLCSPYQGGVPIANEAMWADGSWTNVWGANTRKRYIAVRPSGVVRLVYAAIGGTNDSLPTTPFVIRASIEPTNGVSRSQFTFNSQLEAVIQPGGIMVSDPLFTNLSAGQQFWVWTYFGSPNQYFMGASSGMGTVVAWGEGCDAAANTATSDKTPGVTTLTANAASQFCPVAIIGDAGAGYPFVGHWGDSIGVGLGDSATVVDAGRGFLRRAMNNQIPFVNVCLSGDALGNSQKYRLNLVNGCTDVITNMGVNDLVAAASVSTVETNMAALWGSLSKFGARVWQTTITPKTSSTDVWATVANQTAFANDANRQSVNNWIRAGAPLNSSLAPVAIGTAGALLAGSSGHPLAGYFETADQVETARNSGIWKVGFVYTTDGNGLHPNSTGAAAMAAAINTANFTA